MAIMFTLSLCLFTSCTEPQEPSITEEEALEILEAYLVPASGGAIENVESITSETESLS